MPTDSDEISNSVNEAYHASLAELAQGQPASYIPALGSVNPQLCGIAFISLDGKIWKAGDADVKFSIQSISKIFGLSMAMQHVGDQLWKRVGMEPSGHPFNSIVQLGWEKGIPRNPFINAGSLVIADILTAHFASSIQALITFVQRLTPDRSCHINREVRDSELQHGSRNSALAYLMKSFSNIESSVDEVLWHYFSQCALEMSCCELAYSLMFLANRGKHPLTNQRILSNRDAHRLNAILSTSGMYDQSGEFALTVGLPAKSGVGGGVIAIIPGTGVIAAWSPPLNSRGNSVRGLNMITHLSKKLGLSLF